MAGQGQPPPHQDSAGRRQYAAAAFQAIVADIEAAHDRLGHSLGWRFLYGPRWTLGPETRLALVGLNPGLGPPDEPSLPYVDEGNAYRIERWSDDRTSYDRLQVQVRRLYDALARELGTTGVEELMDETLTAMLCPFRSRGWAQLHRPADSLAFSRGMWDRVFAVSRPKAIISFGADPGTNLGAVLEQRGAQLHVSDSYPTGWGTHRYSLDRYEGQGHRTLLVRLPHLSRFTIFGRSKAPDLVDEIAAPIAAALRER